MPDCDQFPLVEDSIVFHDPNGKPHNAIATAIHGDKESFEKHGSVPCINLVFASGDQNKQDQYGRQLERESSVVHKSSHNAHGNYWRWASEKPNPVIPAQT